MHHHHHHGLDGQQIANTAVGVYAGARAAQGDWYPLILVLLFGGSFSALFPPLLVVVLIVLAIVAAGAVLVGAIKILGGLVYAVSHPKAVLRGIVTLFQAIGVGVGSTVAIIVGFFGLALPFSLADVASGRHVDPSLLGVEACCFLASAAGLCIYLVYRSRRRARTARLARIARLRADHS